MMFMASPPRLGGQGWLDRAVVANRPEAATQLNVRILVSSLRALSSFVSVIAYEMSGRRLVALIVIPCLA